MAGSIAKVLELILQVLGSNTGYDQWERFSWLDQVRRQIIRGQEADCSALTLGIFWLAGYPVDISGTVYTGNAGQLLKAAGFTEIPVIGWSLDKLRSTMRPGDALLGRAPGSSSGHIILQDSDGKWLSAEKDERGLSYGGADGNQTGVEVRLRDPYLRSEGWNAIYRPPADPPVASPLVAGGLTHRVRWANKMNVRATPPINGTLGRLVTTVDGGADGARLTLLPDAAVRVTNADGTASWWRKGRFEGGTIGWMRVDYLQPLAGSTVAM